MSQADRPAAPRVPPAPALPPALSRGLTLGALALLLMFIGSGSQTLWGEFAVLRREMEKARATAVVGYPGIQPQISFAQRPRNWYRPEGGRLHLWSGWREGHGHTWFTFEAGEVPRDRLSLPFGRDVYKAIDEPLTEQSGGPIWDRIPDEALVAGHTLGGVATAYPFVVLSKVAVVNDEVGGTPYLIVFNPTAPAARRAVVYEPRVGGRRVTLGLTGYFLDSRPVYYDRGSESFWVPGDAGLDAVAGPHRGSRLRELAPLSPVAWHRWRDDHPGGRLVVGADRSAAIPPCEPPGVRANP